MGIIRAVNLIFDYIRRDEETEKEDEVVLEVLQKGYKLKDRVIRAAQVKINQK